MPDAEVIANYRARWLHNRRFVAFLTDEFSDWMLTGAFYAAVHAVEALIAFDGQPNHTSHESRNQVLRSVRRYAFIWRHYRELYNASQTARYHPAPGDWIPAEQVRLVWIPRYLYPIEQSVQRLMGESESLPALTWER